MPRKAIDGMKVRHYCSIGATPNRCCSSCLTASDKMGLRGRVPLWVEGKTLLGFGISPNVIEDYKKSNDFWLNNIRYVKQSLKLVISMLYGFSLYLLGASIVLMTSTKYAWSTIVFCNCNLLFHQNLKFNCNIWFIYLKGWF